MKKTPIIIIYICAILSLCACNEKSTNLDIESMVGYIPIKTSDTGRWGMISVDADMLFEDEFVDEPTMAVNGVFSATEEKGISIYSIGEQPHLLADCEGLQDAGFLNDGLMPVVRMDSRISVVDAMGATKFTIDPINGKEILSSGKFYSNGLLVVSDEDGAYGCLDTEGKVAIDLKYKYINNFSGNMAIVIMPDDRYAVISNQGDTVCTVKAGYKVLSSLVKSDEIVVADSTGILAIMGMDGSFEHLPARVKEVGDIVPTMFAFKGENGYWGLMSRNPGNKMLMRPKFKSMHILDAGQKFLVNLDNKWSIVDIRGHKMYSFPDSYNDVVPTDFNGKIKYAAKSAAGWDLLDERWSEIYTSYDISDIGLDAIINPGPVMSRYFNFNAMIDSISDLVTANSIAGIQLNAIANRWYEDQSPEKMKESSEFTPTKQPGSGTGYKLSVVGVTERLITGVRYKRTSFELEDYFIPNNTVYAIELIVDSSMRNIYQRAKQPLIERLLQKGFKLVEDDEYAVTMRSIYANIEISPLEGEEGFSLLLYKL